MLRLSSLNREALLGVFVSCTLYSGALELVLLLALHLSPVFGNVFFVLALIGALFGLKRLVFDIQFEPSIAVTLGLWAVYVAWSVLAANWSTSVEVVGPKLTLFLVINPAFFLFGLLVGSSESAFDGFIFSIKIIAILASVAALTFAFLGTSALVSFFSLETVIFFNANYQPTTFAVATGSVMFFISALSDRRSLFGTLIQIATWAFLAIGTLAAGGRGAAIGAALATIGAIALSLGRLSREGQGKEAKRLMAWSAFAGGLGAIFIYLGLQLQLRTVMRLLNFASTMTDTTGRSWLFNKALMLASEHPIFGAGFASFHSTALNIEDIGNYPHNILLEILAETGVVGLAVYLAFLFTAIYLVWTKANNIKLRYLATWFAMSIMAFLLNMADGTITERFVIFSIGIGLGLVVRTRTLQRDEVISLSHVVAEESQ